MIDSNTPVQTLFNHAIAMLKNVKNQEKFIVRDLFLGIEWNRISIGNKIKLGSQFLNYINANKENLNIEAINKTNQNQQIYKMK